MIGKIVSEKLVLRKTNERKKFTKARKREKNAKCSTTFSG